jgi:hypothetical protein
MERDNDYEITSCLPVNNDELQKSIEVFERYEAQEQAFREAREACERDEALERPVTIYAFARSDMEIIWLTDDGEILRKQTVTFSE